MKQWLRNRLRPLKARLTQIGFDKIGEAPVGPVGQAVLRAMSRRALRPIPLAAAAAQSHRLWGPSSSTQAPPCPVGATPRVHDGHFPALYAHLLQDVTVSPYASGVVTRDRLLLPEPLLRDRDRIRTDGGGLFRLDRRHCIGRITQPARIPHALLIGGAGAFNWYHFLIETLPKAYLAQHLPPGMETWPLLVPDECLRYPSFRKALAVFARDRPIHPVARGTTIQVERLVYFDDISHGPFNLHKGHWPQISDYSQHDECVRDYLYQLRVGLLQDSPIQPPTRRIFLVRPGTRRNYNQDALVVIARRHGFEPHAPETLPLTDQARLLAEAEMVVGASGAAWVGMSFCQKPARFLSWLPREYWEFCSYSTLARLLGHQMEFLDLTPDHPILTSDMAYLHSYRVDPDAFEAALQNMTRTT